MYLASVLPASIKMFLLGGSPVQGAIFHLVLFTLTGFLGGLLSSRYRAWQLESPGRSELEERLGGIQSEAFHQTGAR